MIEVVLFGATELALHVGDRLHEMPDITVVACIGAPPVITASFAPSGRENVRHFDLGEWARRHGVPYHAYSDRDALRSFLALHTAHVAIVAGWYHLIPVDCLERLPAGAVGFHASMLPKFRGAAPLNWAILSGAHATGMSMFKLGDGVDDGPLLGQLEVPIGDRTVIGELIERTTAAAIDLLELLPAYVSGDLVPVPQVGAPSYSLHRTPADGRIDWAKGTYDVDRLVRAVGKPYSGAYSTLDGAEIVIWEACPVLPSPEVWSIPGGILRLSGFENPMVVTGDGLLEVWHATDRDGRDALTLLRRSGHRRLE